MFTNAFEKVKTLLVDHKELAIRIGFGLAGAAIGAAVVTAVIRSQQDSFPYDMDLVVNLVDEEHAE